MAKDEKTTKKTAKTKEKKTQSVKNVAKKTTGETKSTTKTKEKATAKKDIVKKKPSSNKETFLFLEYPKCTTCKKAKKFLEDNKIKFEDRDIVLKNPTAAELKKWKKLTDLPLKRFFNTSGNAYREQNLKDVLNETPEKDWYAILAKDGMLVKRPLLIGEDFILIGFKEEEWKEKLLKK